MGNFFDRTFTVIADILLKLLPASKREKQAFSYYRTGLNAQSKGRYVEALSNYYEALQLEEDPYDRSYILYNVGLVLGYMGNKTKPIIFYQLPLVLNFNLPQAFYNMAIIYHSQASRIYTRAQMTNDSKFTGQEKTKHIQIQLDEPLGLAEQLKLADLFFDKAAEYWIQALELAPDNYPAARNWLKVTGRLGRLDEL